MMNRRSLLALAVLTGLPPRLRAQAPPDPLAALRADQRRAVQAFVRRQGEWGDGSANAEQVIVVDLDGNGPTELASWWAFSGPKQRGSPWFRVLASTRIVPPSLSVAGRETGQGPSGAGATIQFLRLITGQVSRPLCEAS